MHVTGTKFDIRQRAAALPRNAIHSSGFFSDTRFDSLEICEPLKKVIRDLLFHPSPATS